MAELKVARSSRGIACASITQLKEHILRFEGKPEWSKANWQTVQSLIENAKAIDDTFKEHQLVIDDQAEDQAAVVAEQNVLDEHNNKMFSYTNRVLQLLEESQPMAVPTPKMDPSQHLCRRIHEVDREARKIGVGVFLVNSRNA